MRKLPKAFDQGWATIIAAVIGGIFIIIGVKIAQDQSTGNPIPITPTATKNVDLTPTRLTKGTGNNRAPHFSPNGNQIVFLSDRDGNVEIYLMNTDGSEPRRLTYTPNITEDVPVFAPTGEKILFGAYDGFNEELYLMRIDGTQVTNLSNLPNSNEGRPRFSPSGFFITFDSDRTGNCEIYLASLQSDTLTEERQVTIRPDFSDRLPSFSPLGDRIIFRSDIVGGGTKNSQIYSIRLNGDDLTKMSTEYDDRYPSYSPDAKWITFNSDRDGNSEIYLMRSDGTTLKRVTQSLAYDGGQVFSFDGRWLAFESKRSGPDVDIYLLSLESILH
jgi:Tol biopolymer transport system component